MKYSILFIFFLFLISFTSHGDAPSIYADASLGDVVFSYLDEKNFQALHSDDWMQLGAKTDVKDTELCTYLKAQNIPCQLGNFQGKFLRINGGSAAGIGSEQPFSTAKPTNNFVFDVSNNGGHKHTFYGLGKAGEQIWLAPARHFMFGLGTQSVSDVKDHNHAVSIKSGGDAETRPTNIALYAYIRVNTKYSHAKETAEIKAKLAKALAKLDQLERRECPPINTGERNTLVACYAGIVKDFEKGIYLMADGEFSRVLAAINHIMCYDSDHVSKEDFDAFQRFFDKYGSADFSCQ